MNLLADECVAAEIVARLRDDGHDIEIASTLRAGAPDDEVLARAAAAGRVLLTADQDFGELAYRLGRAHAGVILLRLSGTPAMDRANAVSSVLRDKARELHGNFTVVDKDSVRIRRHPPPA